MMKHMMLPAALSALALLAAPAVAQDGAATVTVAQSDKHGPYLTDGSGRALYLFTADTQGDASGGAQPKIACVDQCLDRWPPLYTQGKPQAGDQAEASLLGTVSHGEKMIVTYNGWPLYYFYRDEKPGQTIGQDVRAFGGEWYLVTPSGDKVGDD